jgi:hypothetical protein
MNQHLQVNNCQLILTEPSANNQYMYPSDHFSNQYQVLEFRLRHEK